MQAQSADGVLHDFPDNTDPSVIDRVMKNYAQQPGQPNADAQGARDSAARTVRGSHPPAALANRNEGLGIRDGIMQGAAGFNEGLASTVGRALDVVPYYASKAMGGEGVHPVEGTFRKYFVDPTPPPSTVGQGVMRAGGRMAGENVPGLVTGMGLATSGIRSGVTAAEQAAAQATSKIAPEAAPAAYDVQHPIASTFARIKGALTPNPGGAVEALRPTNVANAVKPTNLRASFDSVADWAAEHPVSATVGDMSSAFQSGAGGQIGHNVAENAGADETHQRMGELAGQFGLPGAVGMYRSYAPTIMAGRAAKAAIDTGMANVPTGPQTAERQAERLAYGNREGKYADPDVAAPETTRSQAKMDAGAAARTTRTAQAVGKDLNAITARPEAKATLAEADALKTDIPGFNPGVAKSTNDPGLINLQRRFESEATGDELRTAQDRTDASRGAIRQKFESIAPEAEAPREGYNVFGGKPEPKPSQDTVAGVVRSRVNDANARIDTQRTAVEGKIKGISDSLPEVDRIEGGQVMRTARDAAQEAANRETTRLRGQVAPGKTVQVGDEQMPINAALDRRAELNQQVRDIRDTPGRSVADTQNMRTLQQERNKLDTAIEQAAGSDAELRAYADHYKNENVPNFRQGASAEVGRSDQRGYEGNRVDPEQVGRKFFNPNEESAARQFNQSMAQDPAAKQQMIDNALDDLRHAATDPATGELKKGGVDKWLRKNERVLNEVAFVREAIAAKNPDQLYERLRQLDARKKQVADTNAASLLGKNPEAHIDGALNDWQVARTLKRSANGDPNAEAALVRAVLKRAPDPLDPKFGEWLEGRKRPLQEMLSPKHLADLQTVTKAAAIENRLGRATGTVEEPKSAFGAVQNATGTSVPTALTTMTTLARGRSNPVYEVARVVGNALNKFSEKESKAIWKEALFNPDVAKTLADVVRSKKATPMQYSKLSNYLLTTAAHDAKPDDK